MTVRRAMLIAALWLAASPARAADWNDFQIIMWQDATPAQMPALKRLGVRNLRVFGSRDAAPDPAEIAGRLAPIRAAGMGVYIENIATDFYAPYHRFLPDHPGQPNWLFEQARARYRASPADPSVFWRDPSLSDPGWQSRVRARLAAHVRAFGSYRPLFYNLADEPGIADLAAPWDFDFSPAALTAFRVAMRATYGSLERLNLQWGSDFNDWDAVMPDTTAAAMRRTDGNYSAWSDFRGWMDFAFANALRLGTEAVHASAQGARAGIEGAQVPGSGGYDYSLLPFAVDVMEGGEDGDALAIARSLNPDLVTLTTTADHGPVETARIWRSMLNGTRGLVIWDGDRNFLDAAGAPGPRAQAMAPLFAELTGGLAAQLIASPPPADRIAILYSPPSQRVRWLLDRQPNGEAWRGAANLSEAEALDDNRYRQAMVRIGLAMAHLGVRPRYLTPAKIANGALHDPELRLLILPQTLALSAREAQEISLFVTAGGLVAADIVPGQYDEHGRQLAQSPLAAPMRRGKVQQLPAALFNDPTAAGPEAIGAASALLTRARAKPGFRLLSPDGQPVGDIEIHQFQTADVTLIALQRSLPANGKIAAQDAETVDLVGTSGGKVYDLRRHVVVDHATRLRLKVSAAEPVVLALSQAILAGPTLAGPGIGQSPGNLVTWQIGIGGLPTGIRHAVRAEMLTPGGEVQPDFSTNIVVRDSIVEWKVPLPPNAAIGTWTARLTDVLTGAVVRAGLEVRAE